MVYIPKWILITFTLQTLAEVWEFTTSAKNTLGTNPTGAELQVFAGAYYAALKTALQGVLSAQTIFKQVTARDMSGVTGQEGTYFVTDGGAGTVTGDTEPLSVCATISYRSSLVGRRGRGRSYISGMPEGFTVGDAFSGAYLTALANVASAILSYRGTTAVPSFPVIASRAGIALHDVLTAIVTTQINVQKRRLPGHRRHRHHP